MSRRFSRPAVLLGGLGCAAGCLLPAALVGLGLVALLSVLGGIGTSQFGASPPPPVSPLARTAAWLPTLSAAGAAYDLPNVLVAAAVAEASHGEALRTTATHPGQAVGLLGLNTTRVPPGTALQSVPTNLGVGLSRLSAALAGRDWQAGLTAFHATAEAPPGAPAAANTRAAQAIRGFVQQYDSGPTLGAWALANWQHGAYTDRDHRPEWVLVAGAAPTGRTLAYPWRPPTVEHVTETVTNPKTGKPTARTVTRVVAHTLTVTDLGEPMQVWGTLKSGRTVAFQLSGPNSPVPAYPGQFLWGAEVPLTGPDALESVTARWPTGVLITIHWANGAIVRVSTWHLISNPQAIREWWPAIQTAAQQTGVPADLIGAVMLHESGGDPSAYNPFGPAYGLMQLLNTTAPGLPGYAPGWEVNGPLNLLLGAELLAEDYQQTGGTSWHAAVTAYYGGLGRMEQDGFVPGMPWSEAAPLLNIVPAANAGNTETMTAYADQMIAEEAIVAREAPHAAASSKP